jgi:hypothetical protein
MSRVRHIITEKGRRHITPAEQSVLWAVADGTGRYGDYAELSHSDLARITKFSKRSMVRAIKTLESDKVLAVDRPLHGSLSHHNRYTINEDRLTDDYTAPTSATVAPVEGGNQCHTDTRSSATQSPHLLLPIRRAKPFAPESPPDLGKADTFSQPVSSLLAGWKKGEKAETQEQAIDAVLMMTGVRGDGLLSRSVLRVCLAMDATVSIEVILSELKQVLAGKDWREVREPGAVIVECMKARMRSLKLRTLEQVSEVPDACTCGRRGRCQYCKAKAKVN